jgi:hypothetical protein
MIEHEIRDDGAIILNADTPVPTLLLRRPSLHACERAWRRGQAFMPRRRRRVGEAR